MFEKTIFTSFFLLILASFIKATTIGIKLFVMACAGLAGMYMVHLLAQDYNKYQSLSRPGRSVDEVFRRSIHEKVVPEEIDFAYIGNNTAKNILNDIKEAEESLKANHIVTLDRILRFDPTGCARRYVCTVAAKSYKKQTQSEKNIIHMLRNLSSRRRLNSGQEAFNFALNLGRRTKDPEACAQEYPKCLFSISQMMKLTGIS